MSRRAPGWTVCLTGTLYFPNGEWGAERRGFARVDDLNWAFLPKIPLFLCCRQSVGAEYPD